MTTASQPIVVGSRWRRLSGLSKGRALIVERLDGAGRPHYRFLDNDVRNYCGIRVFLRDNRPFDSEDIALSGLLIQSEAT